jgi:hypothetical protein
MDQNTAAILILLICLAFMAVMAWIRSKKGGF